MKLNWAKRKLTFVVIRDANESVIQFRMRSIFIFLIPAIIIVSAAAIFILTKLYMDTVHISQQLETRLHTEYVEHDAMISEKDRTIERLMSDVVELSGQAEAVQEKLNELQQISDQIRSINGEPTAFSQSAPASYEAEESNVMIAAAHVSPTPFAAGSAASADPGSESGLIALFDGLLMNTSYPYDPHNGQGGLFEVVSVQDILVLAEDTKANMRILEEKMGGLKIDLEEAKELAIEYQHLLKITPSIWPTTSKRITSTFGYRRDPFTRRLSNHAGIDFGGKTGDPVYATAQGKVIESRYDSALGHHIIIDHTNGIRTLYAHLSKRIVSSGDSVEKGEEIGKLGSTGRSTGPHLHYEVHKSGVPVNPRSYLP